jgi:threonine dehydratase
MAGRSRCKKTQTIMFTAKETEAAAAGFGDVVVRTPLQYNPLLSEEFQCNVFLKREDLQIVRSYKIRGAYHKMKSLTEAEQQKCVVCASAGNHGQGVAYSCRTLNIRGVIFMPLTTPQQKVTQVKLFGKDMIEVVLVGDTFDDANRAALTFSENNGMSFVHPFDDEKVITGQGTVGKEILDDAAQHIDFLILPVGGGGLAAGVSAYFAEKSPRTQIIGAEPEGAPSMSMSLKNGYNTELETIDRFVDGAAVKKVGDKTFAICRNTLSEMLLVPEGKVCTTILQLYNQQAMVVEPAGALSITALHQLKDRIKGKNVVCVVSGSNNDITRTEEIRERSLLYEQLKHYFIVRFPQRAGALKDFVSSVLGPDDDIVHFEYMKKNNRENGPALVGLEIRKPGDLQALTVKLSDLGFQYEYLNKKDTLMQFVC